ncbi:MAG: SpoIID/LytB domain-containing protein [Ignavibacterium sp.]|nr:SpoIID/LytB domain-containing protein [Ignavibacterium sp.]MDW8375033.1 SpoIID/LytB domain-containing protein [Ignavibacteriales bacterium]
MQFESEPWLNVGILSDRQIKFELYGEFLTSQTNSILSGVFTAELKNNKIVCSSKSITLEAEEEIFFEPSDPISESFVLRDVIIGVKFHWERREKQRFNYFLKIIKNGDQLIAINYLPIEAYLTSVISSEMSAKCSVNLLKSQAVVARSWLLAQLKNKFKEKSNDPKLKPYSTEEEIITWYDREAHKLFDVCADDHCQRFQGITKVSTNTVIQAIKETRGIVLISDNEICDTRYSKSCGGISESYENVWEPIKYKYLVPIVDYKYEPENLNLDLTKEENAERWIKTNVQAFCNTTDPKILNQILLDYDQETKDFYRWNVEYSQDQLNELIKRKLQIDFGEIIDLIPVERGYSGRLVKLKIVGTKKTLIIGKELEIRRVLSPTHLYSSAFYVEKKDFINGIPQKFILHGAGWGHGVGLCQIGAAVMAEKGYQFDEILTHYFPNTDIKKIY